MPLFFRNREPEVQAQEQNPAPDVRQEQNVQEQPLQYVNGQQVPYNWFPAPVVPQYANQGLHHPADQAINRYVYRELPPIPGGAEEAGHYGGAPVAPPAPRRESIQYITDERRAEMRLKALEYAMKVYSEGDKTKSVVELATEYENWLLGQ